MTVFSQPNMSTRVASTPACLTVQHPQPQLHHPRPTLANYIQHSSSNNDNKNAVFDDNNPPHPFAKGTPTDNDTSLVDGDHRSFAISDSTSHHQSLSDDETENSTCDNNTPSSASTYSSNNEENFTDSYQTYYTNHSYDSKEFH